MRPRRSESLFRKRLRKFRRLKRGYYSFVIVVSADVQTEAQERAKASGAMAFIQKPVTKEKLLPVLKEYGIYA